MNLTEQHPNVHVLRTETTKGKLKQEIALLSDLHWDNPKCDRDQLKKNLDHCKKHNIPVLLNGDTFCLMQGKYDPRKAKGSIRPEHNVNDYIDAVVNTAADWFLPYADILTVVGYGNHETAILRRQETDVIERFVTLLNYRNKTENGSDHKVFTGGYGGWLIFMVNTFSYRIRYFHGSGGGGAVTKGHINLTRAKESYDNFDCFTMGHVHENTERFDTVSSITRNHTPYNKELLLCITGTYKEEYNDGFMGWHVERGAPPKPIGGRILEINYHDTKNKTPRHSFKARSFRFE